MRFFIGTSIDRVAIDMIEHELSNLRRDERLRFAPAEQWHVTALFVGERNGTMISGMKDAIGRIAASSCPIMLDNGRICTMPKDPPRMLWVVFDQSEVLYRAHLALARALHAPASSHLPYQPHITLARSKRQTDPYSGPIVLKELLLDHLTLFTTQLSPGGSIHHSLQTWPFSGTDPIDPGAVL